MYNILGDDTNNVHSPTTAKLSLSYNSVPLVELKLHHLNPLGARIQNPVSHLHGCKNHICFDVSFTRWSIVYLPIAIQYSVADDGMVTGVSIHAAWRTCSCCSPCCFPLLADSYGSVFSTFTRNIAFLSEPNSMTSEGWKRTGKFGGTR